MTNDKDKIQVQLQRIVKSKAFSKTTTNVKLLQFLVNGSLNEADLKEVTIGIEMFGSTYDPIKNDNKVRVYVYHLRKKLDQYYTEEAAEDEIVFTIVKGQYSVTFSETDRPLNSEDIDKTRINWKTTLAIVLLVVVVGYLGFFNRNGNLFWSENFENIYPTTVLIGDHYTIISPIETGGSGLIRDFNINSDDDFSDFIQQNPEKAALVKPNKYSYITKMGTNCSMEISQYFTTKKQNFDLMLNSEWDKSNIDKQNIVFFGQVKTMHFLKNILLNHFPQYKLDNNNIIRTDPATGVEKLYSDISGDKLVDYTMVAKITGPAGNSYKLFLSEHDGGVINSIKNFTSDEFLKEFYALHNIGDRDFLALFKVSGWERTGYNVEFELIDFCIK